MLLTVGSDARPGGHRPPGRRFSRWVLVTGAAAVALTTAAATPAAPAPAAAPPAAAAPDAGTGATPPIYELVYRPSEAGRRISAAHDRLVAGCMARHGFRYEPVRRVESGDLAADRPTPFGLESLEPPAPEDVAPAEDPNRGNEAYARALYGDRADRVVGRGARLSVSRPASGCVAEAEQRLLGAGRQRWIQVRVLLFEAEEDAIAELERDREFRDATARWRTCMRQAGIDVADPLLVVRDLVADADVRTHPAARADLACKHRTGYLTTAYARLSVMQRHRLDSDPSLTADWTALLHAQDTAARQVLGR